MALGGVATKPWRARNVEEALAGQPMEEAVLRRAALLAMEGAQPRVHNAHKVELAPKVIARALMSAGGLA